MQRIQPGAQFVRAFSSKVEYLSSLVKKDLGPADNNGKHSLQKVIKTVWDNEVVTSQCPNLAIRLTTLRGSVARHLIADQGDDPSQINLLAVGSVAVPNHLPAYASFVDAFYSRTAQYITEQNGSHEVGYDLLSQGDERSRASVFQLWSDHYGADATARFRENSAITCGGMRGLKDLADACKTNALLAGTTHRFVQPDNSFGTWFNIVSSTGAMSHTITTRQENKFHLSVADVDRFYAEQGSHEDESWYITPVGNPSGTKMDGPTLLSVVQRVLEHNARALIILDTVYVRTLTGEDAQALMSPLMASNELSQVVFLESFSKSHGLCRERLGMYFSSNAELFTRLHTANIAFSAGPGGIKDAQFAALGASSEAECDAVAQLHRFWRDERVGLYRHLMQFSELFADQQPHIVDEDLHNPCTLYIMLKPREGVSSRMVFERTGALGVDTKMGSGMYIRFSVGTIQDPTYSTKQ